MINADRVHLIFKTWQAHKTQLAVVHSIAKSISACLFKIETVNTVRANQETSVQCRWCLRLMQMSQSVCAELAGYCVHIFGCTFGVLMFQTSSIYIQVISNFAQEHLKSCSSATNNYEYQTMDAWERKKATHDLGFARQSLADLGLHCRLQLHLWEIMLGESERHVQVFFLTCRSLVCQYVI